MKIILYYSLYIVDLSVYACTINNVAGTASINGACTITNVAGTASIYGAFTINNVAGTASINGACTITNVAGTASINVNTSFSNNERADDSKAVLSFDELKVRFSLGYLARYHHLTTLLIYQRTHL